MQASPKLERIIPVLVKKCSDGMHWLYFRTDYGRRWHEGTAMKRCNLVVSLLLALLLAGGP